MYKISSSIEYNYNYLIPFNLKKNVLRVHANFIAINELHYYRANKKTKAKYYYFGINNLKKDQTILKRKFSKKKLGVFFISNFNMIEGKWLLPKYYLKYYKRYLLIKKKKNNLIKLHYSINQDYVNNNYNKYKIPNKINKRNILLFYIKYYVNNNKIKNMGLNKLDDMLLKYHKKYKYTKFKKNRRKWRKRKERRERRDKKTKKKRKKILKLKGNIKKRKKINRYKGSLKKKQKNKKKKQIYLNILKTKWKTSINIKPKSKKRKYKYGNKKIWKYEKKKTDIERKKIPTSIWELKKEQREMGPLKKKKEKKYIRKKNKKSKKKEQKEIGPLKRKKEKKHIRKKNKKSLKKVKASFSPRILAIKNILNLMQIIKLVKGLQKCLTKTMCLLFYKFYINFRYIKIIGLIKYKNKVNKANKDIYINIWKKKKIKKVKNIKKLKLWFLLYKNHNFNFWLKNIYKKNKKTKPINYPILDILKWKKKIKKKYRYSYNLQNSFLFLNKNREKNKKNLYYKGAPYNIIRYSNSKKRKKFKFLTKIKKRRIRRWIRKKYKNWKKKKKIKILRLKYKDNHAIKLFLKKKKKEKKKDLKKNWKSNGKNIFKKKWKRKVKKKWQRRWKNFKKKWKWKRKKKRWKWWWKKKNKRKKKNIQNKIKRENKKKIKVKREKKIKKIIKKKKKKGKKFKINKKIKVKKKYILISGRDVETNGQWIYRKKKYEKMKIKVKKKKEKKKKEKKKKRPKKEFRIKKFRIKKTNLQAQKSKKKKVKKKWINKIFWKDEIMIIPLRKIRNKKIVRKYNWKQEKKILKKKRKIKIKEKDFLQYFAGKITKDQRKWWRNQSIQLRNQKIEWWGSKEQREEEALDLFFKHQAKIIKRNALKRANGTMEAESLIENKEKAIKYKKLEIENKKKMLNMLRNLNF